MVPVTHMLHKTVYDSCYTHATHNYVWFLLHTCYTKLCLVPVTHMLHKTISLLHTCYTKQYMVSVTCMLHKTVYLMPYIHISIYAPRGVSGDYLFRSDSDTQNVYLVPVTLKLHKMIYLISLTHRLHKTFWFLLYTGYTKQYIWFLLHSHQATQTVSGSCYTHIRLTEQDTWFLMHTCYNKNQ